MVCGVTGETGTSALQLVVWEWGQEYDHVTIHHHSTEVQSVKGGPPCPKSATKESVQKVKEHTIS